MVPFKPYFLGQETPPYDRAVSVQKCVRTPDIEDVGKTTRHGTFFEMCGNFSFGDYFKEGAIELAWDLVTKSQRRRRLRARGEPALPVASTTTTRRRSQLWTQGHRPARRPDHPAGQEGELLVDGRARARRPVLGDPLSTAGPSYGPDGDFGPSARTATWSSGTSSSCRTSSARCGPRTTSTSPARCRSKNIDTGMGLERVAFLLQGVDNMYEIDVMFPVIEKAEELTGRRYGADHDDDVRFRVVADHVRSVDDADRRRRHARQRGPRLRAAPAAAPCGPLDAAARLPRTACCPSCCRSAATRWARPTPSSHRDWERISQIAYAEEDAFRQTLRAGTQIFDLATAEVKRPGGHQLSGDARVRAARHLRLPDRPDPGDGRRAGPRGRRGRLPPA